VWDDGVLLGGRVPSRLAWRTTTPGWGAIVSWWSGERKIENGEEKIGWL
jgi:hypothetical protein